MCEKEPKHKSCTECPQYDGMTCAATDMVLGEREQVLQEEHRRGFICLDTGEAELKGEDAMHWGAEQERLWREQGFYSIRDMWKAAAKQVQDVWNDGPAINVSPAGSPSSECPSLREGPPQKGKTDENEGSHNALRLSCIMHPEARCDNCRKSQKEDGKLHCYQWGIQILMPHRPCEKWALDPAKIKTDDQKEVPSLYKEGMSPELAPGTILVMPDNGIGITNAVPAESVWDGSTPILCSAPADEKGTTLTDQEIEELTDALRTMHRILEQHGVTL